MIFVLRLGRTDWALGFDNPNLVTAMAFQDSPIPIQKLPLRISGARNTRILLEGLCLFLTPDGVFMNGLCGSRLVPIGITFL